MRAARAAQERLQAEAEAEDAATAGSTPATRRAVFSVEPARRNPESSQSAESSSSTPLDLVQQLRGDFEDYTREVYGERAAEEENVATLDEIRERRHQERIQLDSLHARLHGLRLILAMAQMNMAANNANMEGGEPRIMLGESGSDEPGVMLVRTGRALFFRHCPCPPSFLGRGRRSLYR